MLLCENSNFNRGDHFSFLVYFITYGLYSVNLQWKKNTIMSNLKMDKLWQFCTNNSSELSNSNKFSFLFISLSWRSTYISKLLRY